MKSLTALPVSGPVAEAAARALLHNTSLSAREIVEQAMKLAAEMCIYTNEQITIEEL
jgi:ATP-dependent HslUV protease subunit HslV